MDFRVDRIRGENPESRLLAVPSDEGGVFMVDYGNENYGMRVYDQIDLGKIGNSMAEEVESGDTSLVENWFETREDKPGYYKIVHGVGTIAFELSGPHETIEAFIHDFVELSPQPARFPAKVSKAGRTIKAVQAALREEAEANPEPHPGGILPTPKRNRIGL